MLSRDDLQQIRSVLKEELAGFVTKKELVGILDERFADQNFLLQLSFQEVQDQFKETNGRIDSLYNKIDGFLGRITRLDDEYGAITKQMKQWYQFYPLPQA